MRTDNLKVLSMKAQKKGVEANGMRINDELHFSPKFRFADLDWEDKGSLIVAFHDRVYGYYLCPASILVENRNAFAAGVLLVTTIDFLANIQIGGNTGSRIEQWLVNHITAFRDQDPGNPRRTLAKRFYDEFRNGLVHEGRIKNGGQFTYEIDGLVVISDSSVMIVHPGYLLESIVKAFEMYLKNLAEDEFTFQHFRCALINIFQKDVALAKNS